MLCTFSEILLVSVKFLSAILGPEMAAPILWAPRISAFFLQENLHVHKIPRFRGGGGVLGLGGGGKCRFYFHGRGDFSEFCPLTILGGFYRISKKSPKSSADKMNRACEFKDKTLKMIRTYISRIKFPFKTGWAPMRRVIWHSLIHAGARQNARHDRGGKHSPRLSHANLQIMMSSVPWKMPRGQ